MIRSLLLVLFVALLSGCIIFPRPQISTLTGECRKTIDTAYIWRGYRNIYAGDFILAGENEPQVAEKDPYAKLPSGTKFYVKQVLKAGDGSGDFFRVVIEIQNGPFVGVVADVPACAPYYPNPQWVQGCGSDPNSLYLNESLFDDCY